MRSTTGSVAVQAPENESVTTTPIAETKRAIYPTCMPNSVVARSSDHATDAAAEAWKKEGDLRSDRAARSGDRATTRVNGNTVMPKITITAETRAKVEAFRSLGSAVAGNDLALDDLRRNAHRPRLAGGTGGVTRRSKTRRL